MKELSHDRDCGQSCCLRVEKLSVKIGNDEILKNAELHVHCGELAALIGPNGAGKSTLLKAILGQRDYTGVIAFSQPGQRSKKPRIGYVPQSPSFDPSEPISVADLFACCMSRRPAFLGLSKSMRQTVKTCLQRVLLALALEPIPNILILDEPLSGVDVEGMNALMDMLDEIRKTYDLSILMTTHDFSMLPRYADQVALIDHTVLCKGTPQEVLSSEAFRRTFHMQGGSL